MHRRMVGLAVWTTSALLAAALVLPCASYAQERTAEQQIQMSRAVNDAQRQATVAANIVLSEADGAKFWPLYREYRYEVAKLNDKTEGLIQKFARDFNSLTDAEARSMANESLSVERQRVELKSKYFEKFDKVLPGVTAVRVLQVENKLDALVQMDLAKSIPLAR